MATKHVHMQDFGKPTIIDDVTYYGDMNDDVSDDEDADGVFSQSQHKHIAFGMNDNFMEDLHLPLHQLNDSSHSEDLSTQRPQEANILRKRESIPKLPQKPDETTGVRFTGTSQAENKENNLFFNTSAKGDSSADTSGSSRSPWINTKHEIAGSPENSTRSLPLWDIEKNLAEELKNFADMGKLEEESRLLTALGRVYLERAKLTGDGGDFMKASALYNGALNRSRKFGTQSQIESSIERVKDVEIALLKTMFGEMGSEIVCDYDTDKGLKSMLDRMRKDCLKELTDINKNCDLSATGGNTDWSERIAIKRAHSVRGVYHNFADRLKRYLSLLLDECGHVLGEPQCSYGVVALGCLAREVATPYSEVQLAVLVDEYGDNDENKCYAMNLLYLLQLKVIHMGETPIHTMGIKSLNDPTDPERNWFHDSVTEGGLVIRFEHVVADIQSKRKRSRFPYFDLVMTPKDMASLVMEISCTDRGRNLGEDLLAVVHLSGEQSVVDDYKNRITKITAGPPVKGFRQLTPGPRGIKFAQKTVGKDLAKKIAIAHLSEFCHRKLHLGKESNEIDIQMNMCNFSSSAMTAIAQYFQLTSQTPWDVIDEMQGRKLIDTEGANNLRIAVSGAFELQMQTSLHGQFDKRPSSRNLKTRGVKRQVDSVPRITDVLMYRFYYTMLPLAQLLGEAFIETDGMANEHMFIGSRFHDNNIANQLHVLWMLHRYEPIGDVLEELVQHNHSNYRAILDFIGIVMKSKEFRSEQTVNVDSGSESSRNMETPVKIYEEPTSLPYSQLCTIAGAWRRRELSADPEQHKASVVRGSTLSPIQQLGEHARTRDGLMELLSYSEKTMKIELAKLTDGDDMSVSPSEINDMTNIAMLWYYLGKTDKSQYWYGKALTTLRCKHGDKYTSPGAAYILRQLGRTCEAKDEISKAQGFYTQALRMCRRLYGLKSSHPETAALLSNLADCYAILGDSKKALAFHTHSLNMYHDIYGANASHIKIASAYNNTGNAWNVMGDHKKAAHYHRKALEMKHKIYGEKTEHPDVAASLHNLGVAMEAMGDLNGAFDKYNRSFEMKNYYYGQHSAHPDIAVSLMNMGNIKAATGACELAMGYLSQAMAMYKLMYGEDAAHPSIANCLSSIGNLYEYSGSYETAVTYYKQALEMKRVAYKKHVSHPDIAATLNNLGSTFDSLGKYEKSIECYLEALEVYRLSYGEESNHPELAATYSNLGSTFTCQGEYRKALSYYESALSVKTRLYGEDAPNADLALSNVNVGNMWDALGEYNMAVGYHDASLNIYRRVYGEDSVHPDIASVLTNLGNTWGSLDDHTKAIAYHKMALDMYRRLSNDEEVTTDIANALSNLGNDYAAIDNYEKSVECHKDGLEIFKKLASEGGDSLDVASALTNLGNVCDSMGDYVKAMECHKQALGIYRDIHGNTDNVDIASALSNIGNAIESIGDNNAAIDYYEQTLQMYRNIHGQGVSHVDVASSLYNIGSAYDESKEFRKAISYYEQALIMGREVFGQKTEHPLVMSCLHSLGLAWESLGNHDKAKDYFEEAFVREDEGGSSESGTDSL